MTTNKNVANGKRIDISRLFAVFVLLCALLFAVAGCTGDNDGVADGTKYQVEKGETYDSKNEVAAYLIEYGELPPNYITKSQAKNLGWEGGSLEKYAPGKCIGGDRFGNYEKLLPDSSDKDYYHECDIDTLGKDSRGSKRIIYDKDGNVYYTEDHYESFEPVSNY